MALPASASDWGGEEGGYHSSSTVRNTIVTIQELSQGWFARFGDYVDSAWQLRDGHVELSDRPGLGVEVREADIAKLPYEPLPYRQYRHFDGSWKGW